jgi:formylglycine-generating enzyme required for sulfatase activity
MLYLHNSHALMALAAVVLAGAREVRADINIVTNAVGDVGNAADVTGYGAVGYEYAIGRYEVTNAQYAAFLNAKAATDVHGLYNADMAGGRGGIVRSGSEGSYAYSTVSGRDNWSVNFVSFWDAARFANWLSNGQGNGDTETGTYTLTASGIANNAVSRNPGSTWAITSEDEWYKAAYYKGGSLTAGYWLYGTASDAITTAMANYDSSIGNVTSVGSYSFSSAYGAFDMAGNAWEWNEAVIGNNRGRRGGSYVNLAINLAATSRSGGDLPGMEAAYLGFRMTLVPGPSSVFVLALTALGVRGRRR